MNYLKSKLESKGRLPISQISGSHCKNAGTHVSCMYVSSHDNKTNEGTVYAHDFAMALNLPPPKKTNYQNFAGFLFYKTEMCNVYHTCESSHYVAKF